MEHERIACIDMEFGQIYGSYRRDFVPTEIGIVIYDAAKDAATFRGRRFDYAGELVMRKNNVDEFGSRVETLKRVIVPSTGKVIEYDPEFRRTGSERRRRRGWAVPVFRALGGFFRSIGSITASVPLVFLGCAEDVRLMERSGIRVGRHEVIDLQRKLRDVMKFDFSLDRASIVMDFDNDLRFITSKHFRYGIPKSFRYLIKPHKAVGDAARIFLLYKELNEHREEFLKDARELLDRMAAERDGAEENGDGNDCTNEESPDGSSN